jgi:hypothetical protein
MGQTFAAAMRLTYVPVMQANCPGVATVLQFSSLPET